MEFKLEAPYEAAGDQPEAIKKIIENINSGREHSTLLGVTGSGKTFTMAKVIENVGKPTLILSHNKTLAAQLYSEFKQFFPENAVEYFVSYYDYYQPEAYIPSSDTYIEKDLAINSDIEKMRLSTTASLLSGRRDVIVVSSVSCLYGVGNPDDFVNNTLNILKGETISRNKFLLSLVEALYIRSEKDLSHGEFRVKGDTIDIYIAYCDLVYRVVFFGDVIEDVFTIDDKSGKILSQESGVTIYPANIFVTTKEKIHNAYKKIQDDMMAQVEFFMSEGKEMEAKRLKMRVEEDLDMIMELGYCSGIENYSRYFDNREPGTRPFCLMDYFQKDFLMIVDESHVTLPQIHAMYGGDFSRKTNLVNYGFRLPSALDNRPLKFEEYEKMPKQMLYVSATPADYELVKSGGEVIEQIIRPTGLLDPPIEVRPITYQIDDLIAEVNIRVKKNERTLVTTITKRSAEELSKYLTDSRIKSCYIHSDIDTMERIEIIAELRKGTYDVLVGVNLLREGLDIPEVSLVAILDADKEGFLRNARSLIQTSGRAARNPEGRVIMYADRITKSMQITIDKTLYHREKQMAYNKLHNITPKRAVKSDLNLFEKEKPVESLDASYDFSEKDLNKITSVEELEALAKEMQELMLKAVKSKEFLLAAKYRDAMEKVKKRL